MMKQISTRLLTALGLCMFLFSACNNSSEFTVKGVVTGADGQLMYLENVGISNVVTLDSIKLAPGGKFKFTEKRPEYPDFYRLRLNNQLINFAVDSTETISFVADAGTFATSYSVEGSENSKAIKAITLAQLDANQAISRLRKEYEDKMISDTTYRMKVLAAADAYKEVARKYIYSAPMSTAAYFALFQQIDGLLFFAFGSCAITYQCSLCVGRLVIQWFSRLRSGLLCDRAPLERSHIGKVAIFFRVVEPIADHEFIRTSEPQVVTGKIGLFWNVLTEKRRNGKRCGLARLKILDQIAQRETRIDHIFGDEHIAAHDVGRKIFLDTHDTRAFSLFSVRRNCHEIHFERKIDLANQIGHEDRRTAQDRDDHKVFSCIIARDGRSHFMYPRTNVALREQNALKIGM